jgi:predicted Zn-dependent peptidase
VGERETLDRIGRDDVVQFWKQLFHAGRLQVSVAGAIEAEPVADTLQRAFEGFGSAEPSGRAVRPIAFDACRTHHEKELEQVQICVGFTALPKDHPQYPVQRVILTLLAAGMSSRLFTEVREKQGLVYWVSAWGEYPRGAGMVFVGASSRTEHCQQSYDTILRELDRLTVDITEEEIRRAVTQIEVQTELRSDRTRARCSELADDLFHFGRLIPTEEKLDRVRAVTLDDIRRYQAEYPWKPLSVVTLGPRALRLE